jgi:hypothetical protein
MNPIGLLIEFKDGRVKEANFGMATAAQGENRQLGRPGGGRVGRRGQRIALEAYGVARIVNISTGKQALGSRHPGRCGGGRHAAI